MTSTIVDNYEWNGKSAICESPEAESKWLLVWGVPSAVG